MIDEVKNLQCKNAHEFHKLIFKLRNNKLILYLMLLQVFRSLVENTKTIKCAKVENQKICVYVYYCNVDEKVIIALSLSLSLSLSIYIYIYILLLLRTYYCFLVL